MRKQIGLISVVFLGLLICNYFQLQATTNCIQTFTFLGATTNVKNEIAFWIGEDVSGECHWSNLIQVSAMDSSSHFIITGNTSYGNWVWLKEGLKNLDTVPYVELVNEQGIWSNPEIPLKMSVPSPDSETMKLVNEANREGYDEYWTRKYGLKGIILPAFQGAKAKLVYYYPLGLYVKYEISAIYYVRFYKSMIVFTRQPRLANGLNSMHGFLVFKIIE